VSQVDLAPTILALAGLKAPPTMQGKPLPRRDGGAGKPVFVGSNFIKVSEFIPDRQDAIIVWPWKLILPHDHMDAPGEFYNLSRDPGEREPLVENRVAELLRRELKAWKKATSERLGPTLEGDYGAAAADLRALGYIQ
jgi:arylsulfatase A-like enzyme